MPKQSKSTEVEFFNQFGEGKSYDAFDERGYRRIVGEFLKYFNLQENLTAVDLGCGTGAFTGRFLNANLKLYGVDLSENCVDYARKKYPQVLFSVGDIEHLDFSDEFFDVVFLTSVLHHFPDMRDALRECRRILKKGGVLLSLDPNKNNPFMRLYRSKGSPFYSSKGVTANEEPVSANDVKTALESCGFYESKVYSISGVTYKYVDHKMASLILPVYNFI